MSVPAVPDLPPAGTGPPPAEPGAAAENTTIRPFRVHVPQDEVAELRRRVAATRWPDRETVADRSQGAQRAKIQELVAYWGTGYDWRKAEATLNALPQFVTEIDGLDIHFIHVRSAHQGALPMIMTHGWPGSVLELLKVIGPLTDPTAHGGRAEDAFDLVLPSMPGYGFSGRPTSTGWGPDRIARAWTELMARLGLPALRLPRRGLGVGDLSHDGPPGTRGAAGYPRQHARDRAYGNRQGAPGRRSAASGAVGCRKGRLRADGCPLQEWLWVRRDDGDPPADPGLLPGRFAGRARRLVL